MRKGWRRWMLEALLARTDYDLKDRMAPMRSYATYLELAKRRGLSPGTVIDVGVAWGTPWLHGAFPDAYLVLVEPQRRFSAEIAAMLAGRRGEWIAKGLGDVATSADLHVMLSEPGSSSLRTLSDGAVASLEKLGVDARREDERVEVVRLDTLDTAHWPRPWLLKIDVEGFELEVLRGAGALLGHVDLVIAELSLTRTYEGTSFASALAEIEAMGFRLAEIIEMQATGRDGQVTMIDGAFVPIARDISLAA